MTPKIILTVGTGLFSLALLHGAAEAGKGGGSNSSSRPSSSVSSSSSPARISESRKSEPKFEKREVKIAPKVERRIVERIVRKPVEQRVTIPAKPAAPAKIKVKLADKAAKVALNPQPLPPKAGIRLGSKVAVAGAVVGGAHLLNSRQANASILPKAPLADSHKRISEASMHKFIAANAVQRNAQTIKPSDGVKHAEAVKQATTLIKDPSKGYKVATYGDKTKPPGGTPAGDNSTIVINGNNKTVYVPASSVSGPDNRTIVVNCNNCKVVIVGDTSKNGQPVIDNRNIVVNGNHDKVVLQGDKANGAAGQNGGSVTDSRHVTVTGDKNKIAVQGDGVNGGNGANSPTGRGQDGSNGGKVVDNRQIDITATGDKNKVSMGGDSANGGKGGNGQTAGGNGGAGGDVTDKRQVNDQGDHNKVDTSRTDTANGGSGGSGQPL